MPAKKPQSRNREQPLRNTVENVQWELPAPAARPVQAWGTVQGIPMSGAPSHQTWPTPSHDGPKHETPPLEEAQSEGEDYFDDIGFPETDVTLVVEDKKIHVNKAVLSQHSPVFNAMFTGNFKEMTAKEVTLKNKKAKDVVEFLRCFYPNMKHPITEHSVLQILPLAHEYQSAVVADCEEFMISMCKPGTSLTVTSFLDYILQAEKYDLRKFLDSAVKFCAHIDFDLLNGKTFKKKAYYGAIPVMPSYNYTSGQQNNADNLTDLLYDVQEMEKISLKFKELDLKTRHAIAEKRLQVLEMNSRKIRDHNINPFQADHKMNLL
ncbi:kelch-like protein 6 [Saccostrea cucullata]|uniref:kelch-like protein 6 n=1 Tax=Saccostrea cuccullata TaxID=36930 RepID=UPI002ED645F6